VESIYGAAQKECLAAVNPTLEEFILSLTQEQRSALNSFLATLIPQL
jgi:hypothetical protein